MPANSRQIDAGFTAADGTEVQPSKSATFQLSTRQLAATSRHDNDPECSGLAPVGQSARRDVNCSKLLLVNGRSLNPSATSKAKWKMEFLKDQVVNSDHPVMAVGLTETWWNSRVEDAQVNFPGYSLFRSDREERTGGGCALLVHASLIVTDKLTLGNDCNCSHSPG